MNETVEIIAEALVEEDFQECNIWHTIDASEKEAYRNRARRIIKLIDTHRAPGVNLMELPPDPNDPVPVTFDTIFEVVRKSLGVSRTNIRYPNGEKWYAEVRRVAVTLARRHITPTPTNEIIAGVFGFARPSDVVKDHALSITKEANKCRIEQLADFVEKNMNVPTRGAATQDTVGELGDGGVRDIERETLAGL